MGRGTAPALPAAPRTECRTRAPLRSRRLVCHLALRPSTKATRRRRPAQSGGLGRTPRAPRRRPATTKALLGQQHRPSRTSNAPCANSRAAAAPTMTPLHLRARAPRLAGVLTAGPPASRRVWTPAAAAAVATVPSAAASPAASPRRVEATSPAWPRCGNARTAPPRWPPRGSPPPHAPAARPPSVPPPGAPSPSRCTAVRRLHRGRARSDTPRRCRLAPRRAPVGATRPPNEARACMVAVHLLIECEHGPCRLRARRFGKRRPSRRWTRKATFMARI
mmetsp:Transcript_75211/g.244598  ORF Transcript_75211/g.244598 Transcript_75211/m.244598 type:complete len:278 (-) Transcript_75211:363-1196(-)